MKILGIIGGMSPESTATYYTEINRLVNQKKGGNISAPLMAQASTLVLSVISTKSAVEI